MDLLIDTFGTRIGASGERIVLSFPNGDKKKEYPIRRLDKIVILRPASLTTNAVTLALQHDIDIVYLGAFGKPIGRFFSSEPKGLASVRKAQLEVSNSPARSFALAKAFVRGKCANQINHMRYLGKKHGKDLSRELLQAETMLASVDLLPSAGGDKAKEQLLGTEGYIADRYFACLRKLCRFPGRITQGRDKYNSMLNYGYGILYNEVERACLYVGLDPYLGLYHSERYGKPALVLDLVEEFRVPIVDVALFPLFINKEVSKRKYFEKAGSASATAMPMPADGTAETVKEKSPAKAKGAGKSRGKPEYQLSKEGKALVVEAVMRNLYGTALWRGKEYAMKQIVEQQIRALARHFTEKEKSYDAFDTFEVRPEDGTSDDGR